MTVHRLTAGDGYLYLVRQVAGGDVQRERGQSAADYYTAQGNPPGRWMGRGLAVMGVSGEVSEEQMRALFGLGMHPDAEARMAAYRREHITASMTDGQLARVNEQARRKVQLGRAFPDYRPLEPFDMRVAERLAAVREETGREPNEAEVAKIQREESARSRSAVAGFDLVFTPVKSASVLWALDERAWVRRAVKDAHDAARDRALVLIEDHGALTRNGAEGNAQIDTRGLTMAVFDHWDSRLGDPNLHTHVAVSNKVQGNDGTWRSLDSRALYRLAVAASEYYNTAFEHELSARLGVSFTVRPDTSRQKEPVREIAGIDPAWIEHFARRRAAVEARHRELTAGYRRAHGRDPSTAVALQLAQQATLETRPGKKAPRSLADRRTEWTASFTQAFGAHALDQLAAAVPDRSTPTTVTRIDVDALAARAVALVQEMRSTWTRWNVLAEIERLVRPLRFTGPDEHDRIVGEVLAAALAAPHSLCVEAPDPVKEPPALRRGDGTSVFVEHGAARFTSHTILDAEARLLDAARTATTVGVDGPTIAVVLADHERRTGRALDPGQRGLVTAFAGDGRLLLTGIGPAGSGKTTAMRAFAEVIDAAGMRLIPLATSSTAAAVLGDELGVSAENLHKFVYEWTLGAHATALAADGPLPQDLEFFRLRSGDVILVDEAGMAGTLNLARLVWLATQKGAVVRLLGDHRQLGAVESGGALRLIAAEVGAVELTTLYRFHDPAEANATLKLRVGDTSGLDFYFAHDRVRRGSRQEMTAAAYTGWKADMLVGKTSLMAAPTNADVTQLSARARADRVAAGQVEAAGVLLHDGTLAGWGDWIVTRDNHRRLRMHGHRDYVKNGDAWRVLERRADGSLQVEHLNHAARLVLPAAYVARYVELLYATTTHRAQGSTIDTAHPLVTPEMGRENLYVIASRARERTTLYVGTHELASPDPDELVDRVRFDPAAFAAREILERILERETTPLSATETIRQAQADTDSLSTLVPRYRYALDHATDRTHRDLVTATTPDLAAELLDDPAWPALRRALRAADHLGWKPSDILTAVRQRPLGDAESLAKVLAWRIDRFLEDHEPPLPTAEPDEGDRQRYTSLLAAALPGIFDLPPAVEHQRDPTAPELRSLRIRTAIGTGLLQAAAANPAHPALDAAVQRATDDGWRIESLLGILGTDVGPVDQSLWAELFAWRLNIFIRTHTPPLLRAPETEASAWARICRVLKGAEANGGDAHAILAAAATRDSGRYPRMAGLLHQVERQAARAATGQPSTNLPSWIPPLPTAVTDPVWTPYLTERAQLINTRISRLGEQAAATRPAWTATLGPAPTDADLHIEWQHHLGVIAAYREQYRVRDDHPHRPLGPYVETGRSGHTAYLNAAASAHHAHHLALENVRRNAGDRPDSHASTDDTPAQPDADIHHAAWIHVVTDLYRSLPPHQQEAIATHVAEHANPAWYGDPDHPDPDTATQPMYHQHLANALVEAGHLTTPNPPGLPPEPIPRTPAQPAQPRAARPGWPVRQTAVRRWAARYQAEGGNTAGQQPPTPQPRRTPPPHIPPSTPRGPSPRM